MAGVSRVAAIRAPLALCSGLELFLKGFACNKCIFTSAESTFSCLVLYLAAPAARAGGGWGLRPLLLVGASQHVVPSGPLLLVSVAGVNVNRLVSFLLGVLRGPWPQWGLSGLHYRVVPVIKLVFGEPAKLLLYVLPAGPGLRRLLRAAVLLLQVL